MRYFVLIIGYFLCAFTHAQINLENRGKEDVTIHNYRSYSSFNQNIDPLNPHYALLDACLFYAINEQRVKHHLPVLPWNIALETASFYHSKAMAQYNFFSHYNMLDSNRISAENRAQLAGIINPLMGECIAQISFTKPTYLGICDEFVNLWMNSAPHRKIILSDNANAVGIGIYFSDKADIYATMDVQCYRIAVYNETKVTDKLPFSTWFESANP